MTELQRDTDTLTGQNFDLIVVGGGIYGAMIALEATRRQLKPLLLEKNDFFSGTSLNHLRTMHGGLRYLQHMDLKRFYQSVNERKWFLKYFPRRVTPMPCLLPLYGNGLYRNSIFRAALAANDVLSLHRNRSISPQRRLGNGKIISPKKVQELFPGVDAAGLTGGACWYDANFQEYQRLMMGVLKTATTAGAHTLNYVEVTGLVTAHQQVAGVRAIDHVNGKTLEFSAPVVINAAGPWCRDVAARLNNDHPPLFTKRMLVWNVLFDKPALSGHSLGLSPGKGRGHTYFFHPWKNRLLVGTGETIVENNPDATVPHDLMGGFIADINTMVPGLNLEENDILRVYSGILPAREDGNLARHPAFHDHGDDDGPKGLYSISGVKFTTSRLVADNTLDVIFPQAPKIPHENIPGMADNDSIDDISIDYDWEPGTDDPVMEHLKKVCRDEAVVHLADLVLRRTTVGDNPQRALKVLPRLRSLFDWDDERWASEVEMLKEQLNNKRGIG